MSSAIAQNANVYTDVSSLKALKGQLRSGENGSIEKVAKQFEALFLQMMLSGMRKTIQVNEEYSNDKAMYYDLFDKQVALNLSGNGGIGLAKVLMSQLAPAENKVPDTTEKVLPLPTGSPAIQASMPVSRLQRENIAEPVPAPVQTNNTVNKQTPKQDNVQATGAFDQLAFENPMQFIKQLWGIAKDVIQENGLDPKAVIAQAALETGWGKHIIRNPDGRSSFNLFGIKSNSAWEGDRVKANTLEFKDGVMQRSKENFRSYSSLEDSVRDYVSFIRNNQRYQQAIEQRDNPAAYATELQRAGYATDPDYASKIINIMNGKEFNHFFASLDA